MNARFRFDLDQTRDAGCAAIVAGADEAGRGALAGPLVAAAVCFDYRGWKRRDYAALERVDDSKKLAPPVREGLYGEVLLRARQVVVTACAPSSIDGRGLHVCNKEALAAALAGLQPAPQIVFVDGFALGEAAPLHRRLIGGDGRSAAVAAASIVAKVTRDRVMRRLHEQYPEWGFDEHVGYATPAHHDAIARHGVCVLHRTSFQSMAYRQLDLGFWQRQPSEESVQGGPDGRGDT